MKKLPTQNTLNYHFCCWFGRVKSYISRPQINHSHPMTFNYSRRIKHGFQGYCNFASHHTIQLVKLHNYKFCSLNVSRKFSDLIRPNVRHIFLKSMYNPINMINPKAIFASNPVLVWVCRVKKGV